MIRYNNLNNDGFTFSDSIFTARQAINSKNALWEVINCKYDTGLEPETRFWNPGDNPTDIIKIDKPHLCSKELFKLITKKKFGKKLADITKSKKIQVWHTQGVWKPSGGGQKGNAGWHRDIQYWPFWKPYGVHTAWIALTDVKFNSGPVRYIKGSNSWEGISGVDFFNKNVASQEKIIQKLYKQYEIVEAEISAGSLAIHSSQTYHSSLENTSGSERVGMVVHFSTDKAKRIDIRGENSTYLDILDNQTVCPVIYDS